MFVPSSILVADGGACSRGCPTSHANRPVINKFPVVTDIGGAGIFYNICKTRRSPSSCFMSQVKLKNQKGVSVRNKQTKRIRMIANKIVDLRSKYLQLPLCRHLGVFAGVLRAREKRSLTNVWIYNSSPISSFRNKPRSSDNTRAC